MQLLRFHLMEDVDCENEIKQELEKKPYSDRILAEKLGEAGLSISRRTVAKYREAIGIADASGRKVFERKNTL